MTYKCRIRQQAGAPVLDADRLPRLQPVGGHAKERSLNQQIEWCNYAQEFGVDEPEAAN